MHPRIDAPQGPDSVGEKLRHAGAEIVHCANQVNGALLFQSRQFCAAPPNLGDDEPDICSRDGIDIRVVL